MTIITYQDNAGGPVIRLETDAAWEAVMDHVRARCHPNDKPGFDMKFERAKQIRDNALKGKR